MSEGPTIYALHGFIACGKTTLAKKLEKDTGAIRFTIDEAVAHFYGAMPANIDEANAKVRDYFYTMTPKLLTAGVSVVLDLGYFKRKDRGDLRELAKTWNVPLKWYNVSCDDKVALERCLQRSSDEQPLAIDEAAYWAIKMNFEPMGEDEAAETVDTTV